MSVSRHDVNGTKTGVNLKYEAKRASTAITEGTFLTRHTDGTLTPATAASANILGVAVRRAVAADADYAANTRIAYDAAREGEEFIVDVDDATTVGFQAGVSRALVNAGQVKAAAVGSGEVATVVVKRVLPNDKAVVTVKTETL
jgi:hypothetical protein